MIFSFLKKAPLSAGFAADLSPKGAEAAPVAKRHLSFWGRGRPAGAGEGAFSEESCAIWNDINRALDAKPRSAK